MQSSKVISVMYHYVQPAAQPNAGFYPLQPEEFEQQIIFLKTLGRLCLPDDLQEPSDAHRIVLTFDDGTHDHYEYALPLLQKHGACGVFGVISSPYVSGHMPNVHLIHWLCSHMAHADIWQSLNKSHKGAALGDEQAAQQLYFRDTPIMARIKYALNFALDADQAGAFLHDQLHAQGFTEQQLIDQWYLSREQVVALHKAGMDIAVHAHRHIPYAGPPETYYDEELAPCAELVGTLTGRPARTFIAAYGGTNKAGAQVQDLTDVLQAHGIRRGYLTQQGIEDSNDCGFFFQRIDAADLPPRKPASFLMEMIDADT